MPKIYIKDSNNKIIKNAIKKDKEVLGNKINSRLYFGVFLCFCMVIGFDKIIILESFNYSNIIATCIFYLYFSQIKKKSRLL